MTDITRLNYISQHLKTTRAGTIAHLDQLTYWPAVESSLGRKNGIPARVAVAKFLYEWWATNYKLHQRQSVSNEEEGDQCPCGCGTETAYHIRTDCLLEHYVNVRRTFVDERKQLILNSDFSPEVKQLFSEIMELKDDGTYPDLAAEGHLWADDQNQAGAVAPQSENYQDRGSQKVATPSTFEPRFVTTTDETLKTQKLKILGPCSWPSFTYPS